MILLIGADLLACQRGIPSQTSPPNAEPTQPPASEAPTPQPIQATNFNRAQMLRHLVTEVVVPTYGDFAKAAQTLRRSTVSFCQEPSEEHLQPAQDAWKDAVALWKRSESYRLGPAMAFDSSIDFWPTRPKLIRKALNDSHPITESFIEFAGTPAQGLPAIEFLLFLDNEESTAVIASYQNLETGKRRCEYLQGLAQHTAQKAQLVHERWQATKDQYLDEFDSEHAAVSAVVNQWIIALETSKNTKLTKPFEGNGRSPWPKSLEAWRSGHSLQNLRYNLQGFREVYLGKNGVSSGIGFDDYLQSLGSPLATQITQQLQVTEQALNAIPEPLAQSLKQHPQTVESAIQELKKLTILVKSDMTNLLSITVDFSDNDGD